MASNGWAEQMAMDYGAGLEDGQHGRPSREKFCDFKACYREGYAHGADSAQEGAQDDREG